MPQPKIKLLIPVEIKAEKQDNGLWGTPMNLKKLDKFIPLSDNDQLKQSAIIIAISERYPHLCFEIYLSDDSGFFVSMSNGKIEMIKYSDYDLHENILTWKIETELTIDELKKIGVIK